jgi:protein TonB
MTTPQRKNRRLPLIAGLLVGAVLLAGFAGLVHSIMADKGTKPDRKVQVVQLIRPPPPPDTPPPPPPPDKPEEATPTEEPEPTPSDEPAPTQQLGLDSDGSAGGDAFGLAAHKGGHDLAGSGGAVFAWYTTRLKDQVADRLGSDSRVRSRRFSVAVRVWIEPDGRIRQVRLADTTGNRELDGAIESALEKMQKMAEPPPLEMPQPISLRIVSRS